MCWLNITCLNNSIPFIVPESTKNDETHICTQQKTLISSLTSLFILVQLSTNILRIQQQHYPVRHSQDQIIALILPPVLMSYKTKNFFFIISSLGILLYQFFGYCLLMISEVYRVTQNHIHIVTCHHHSKWHINDLTHLEWRIHHTGTISFRSKLFNLLQFHSRKQLLRLARLK